MTHSREALTSYTKGLTQNTHERKKTMLLAIATGVFYFCTISYNYELATDKDVDELF